VTGDALDRRPVIVAIAGPNGAGKTTFFHSHLRDAGLRFVNADDIAHELEASPYEAAEIADALRRELVRQRESFVFETVFSDPAGAKVAFLKEAATAGLSSPFRPCHPCRRRHDRQGPRAFLLRQLGHDRFGREEQAADGGRVLQRAERVTLVGSTTPALTRSTYSPVATL
jgi:hypothetical protein